MSTYTTLSKLQEGTEAKMIRVTNDQMACKLFSMGVLPGRAIKLVRKAPLGGGYYLKIANQNMAVREEEASAIIMEI